MAARPVSRKLSSGKRMSSATGVMVVGGSMLWRHGSRRLQRSARRRVNGVAIHVALGWRPRRPCYGALPADDTGDLRRRGNPKIRGCESRSIVSAGTRQPAARRSQTGLPACLPPRVPRARRRGAPAATPRPRQQPLVRGRQAVVKDVGVRPPNDGQAAADDARPRPPDDATPAAVHVMRVDPQRLVHAPHPHLPPLRRRRRRRRGSHARASRATIDRSFVQRLAAALVRAQA